MPLRPMDVSQIRVVSLPAVWTFDQKKRPIHNRHLACEAEQLQCTASVIQTRMKRVVRLQATLPSAETLLLGRESQAEDLFGTAAFVLHDTRFNISGDTLVPSSQALWRRHPKLLEGAANKIADMARTSWIGGPFFVEERRGSNGSEVRPGFRIPQIGALHAIAAHWSVSSKPAVIVMPTGTGKTEVMLACLVLRRPMRLLVVVPSDALRLQTFDKFTHLGILYGLGAVDPSVIRPVVGRITNTPRDTDLDAVDSCNVVVTTVAALQGMPSRVLRRFLGKFDTVFFDEAHHIPALSWERVYENLGEQVVLQFTATPFRLDGQRMPGRIIYNFPLRAAQTQGYFRRIHFRDVFEPEQFDGDSRIADVAVQQLRADLAAGFSHLLLARADTTERAEAIFRDIYLARYPDLHPVVIHSRVKGYHRVLAAIRAGLHKIIVCVDMFGEGLDLPALKIAALHDPHKSLGVTLQFTGRFTRDVANIGDATVVANIADPRVSDVIEELYAEDSDWNELIPELSSKAIQSQVDFSDFLERMERSVKGDEDLFDLNVLRPKTSTVIFRANAFKPQRFRNAVRKGSRIERVWQSKDKDLLIFILRSKVPIEWATIRETSDEVWDIFVLRYDQQQRLLFIHSSQKGLLHQDLAKAVAGDDVLLLSGERMFRAFHGISRLIFHNVGLYNRGTKLRFRMYTGLDVGDAINPAVQAGATKSNLFAVGYDDGQRVSVGVSHKGRVWSMSSSSVPDWMQWCGKIANKVLDERIPTNEFLKHTLIPKEIAQLPAGKLFTISFPSEWYSSEMENTRIFEGQDERNIHELGIVGHQVRDPENVELLLGCEGSSPSIFRMVWGPSEGQFTVVHESGPPLKLRISGIALPLQEYLHDHPPALLFADGSEVFGSRLLEVNQPLIHTYDTAAIVVRDWTGTDIETESKWKRGACRQNSIQSHMIAFLSTQDNRFVFDDDDAGEVADIVEIVERPQELVVRLYHCKYSSGSQPGDRVKDLYEVCGQAVRSVRWTIDPQHLMDHLQYREKPRMLNGRPSRFEKGDLRALVNLKKRMRRLRVRYEIAIVQPGISKLRCDPETTTILGAANAFILDITGTLMSVIASA